MLFFQKFKEERFTGVTEIQKFSTAVALSSEPTRLMPFWHNFLQKYSQLLLQKFTNLRPLTWFFGEKSFYSGFLFVCCFLVSEQILCSFCCSHNIFNDSFGIALAGSPVMSAYAITQVGAAVKFLYQTRSLSGFHCVPLKWFNTRFWLPRFDQCETHKDSRLFGAVKIHWCQKCLPAEWHTECGTAEGFR